MRPMAIPEIRNVQPGSPDAFAAPRAGNGGCMRQLPPPERREEKHGNTAFLRP